MKISTLTCHRAYNYGAVLQTYALQNFLSERGHEVQVLDYAPCYLRKTDNKVKQFFKYILQFHDRFKAQKTFNSFLKRYINLTETTFSTYDDLVKKSDNYDLYVVGSDQVWNMNMKNGNDDSYFLRFAPKNSKKISYAASIAMDSFSEKQEQRMNFMLKDYSAVSVREITGESLLKNIGIECCRVCDPVFLLEDEKWSAFALDKDYNEDYILVYAFYGQKEIYRYARELAKKLKCKVYAVGTKFSNRFFDIDKYFWTPSPNEFVSLIKNSTVVVTNSFHGLCFSMIYCKPVRVFKTTISGNSRIIDMLKTVNAYKENGKFLPIGQIDDYEHVNEKIGELKMYSKEFLKGCGI